MTEKQLIGNILGVEGFSSFEDEKSSSTLILALNTARQLTGRNIKTGKVESSNKENIEVSAHLFVGLTTYLIIVDLIGSLFSNKLKNEYSDEGIQHCLRNFTDLDTTKIKSIKNLRNSLAHNFSLGNKSAIFSLSNSHENMITLPNPNNQFIHGQEKNENQYTKINDFLLCDFIENIHSDLLKLFFEDNLKLKRGLNINIVKSKFTIK